MLMGWAVAAREEYVNFPHLTRVLEPLSIRRIDPDQPSDHRTVATVLSGDDSVMQLGIIDSSCSHSVSDFGHSP